jgi:hypothetical protein
MVLKMRGVPPKPTPRAADGVLVAPDDADDAVTKWYASIAVSTLVLDDRANARFGGADPAEWEWKYVGKIIRGE